MGWQLGIYGHAVAYQHVGNTEHAASAPSFDPHQFPQKPESFNAMIVGVNRRGINAM